MTPAPYTPALSLHAWLRYDAVSRQLKRVPEVRSILEIGAGQGAVGVLLARRYDYVGLEPDANSFETARARFERAGVREIRQAYVSELPIDVHFDLVCAFEVLEHIEDDGAAVAEWVRRIRPGGWLLLSVPAGRHRFGTADVKAGHCRRYDYDDLAELIASAGLVDTSILRYGFPAGYALEAARHVIARREETRGSLSDRTAASGRWLQPPDWSAEVMRAFSLPLRALQRPFTRSRLGTNLLALSRRPA